MLKCSNCGTPYTLDDSKCAKCGHVLFDPERSTVAVTIDPSAIRLRRIQPANTTVHPDKTVALVVRGMVERFVFQEGTEVLLGRTDCFTPNARHMDLARYGGQDKGVSRNHALLRFSGEAITITDLGSSNGTYLNARRLEPNMPQPVHAEDKLTLGSLAMIVRFE
jgi:hypothetical protein